MKRRLKKGFVNLIVALIFSGLAIASVLIFDLDEKVKEKFITNDIKFGVLSYEKPYVKIIDEKSDSRVIAVSINNNHAAWPHAGLQDAYLGYELIAEGGITRLLAFFKNQNTEKIGSVRSARHYFLDYILENDAIFVHFGFSPQAESDISSLSINNINGIYDSSCFYRDTSLKKAYEHTAFTTMAKINKCISSKKYRTTSEVQLLNYSPIKVDYSSDGTIKSAKNVSITYSSYQTTSYTYDEENMVYLMYMSGSKHVDAVTKKQYTVKNIITYQVENSAIDSYGRQDLKNIGSGEGYYISNGQAIKIKWSKASRSSKTEYSTMDGKELIVNDGNTWIHIQPKNKKLIIE